jgi:hypothetical protein
LAAWFTGYRGNFSARVEVVRVTTGDLVFRTQDHVVALNDPLDIVLAAFVLKPKTPDAGFNVRAFLQ